MKLDKILLSQFTEENYEVIFKNLVESKTDSYTNEIKLPVGVDGLKYENIEKNIKQISRSFCKRANAGKYIFSPFREMQIPKAPYTIFEFAEAKAADKLRTLAISTINDTIFQTMIYDSIYDYTEQKYYKELDNNIFGYRKGKSVNLAIREIKSCIDDGYIYGLDGDIEKYFDKINHERLIKKIERFYGKTTLVTKYLKRFLKVKRVLVKNKKNISEYYHSKPITEKRNIGIPQGGVLSGLLANIYLYNFDKYVTSNLASKYDIKYFRYADDFIILCKDPSIIKELYKKCRNYFLREKLHLHDMDSSAIDDTTPNENKTKAINLSKKHYIDFLGFRISPNYVGIKGDNIRKFKKNISHILENSLKEKASFETVIYRINSKILGNGIWGKRLFCPCMVCNKPQKPQSWVGFFIEITDLRVLKNLDIWLRKQLHIYYRTINNGHRLDKHYFKHEHRTNGVWNYYRCNLQSLFKTSLYIKSWYKKYPNASFCECRKFIPDLDISIY